MATKNNNCFVMVPCSTEYLHSYPTKTTLSYMFVISRWLGFVLWCAWLCHSLVW